MGSGKQSKLREEPVGELLLLLLLHAPVETLLIVTTGVLYARRRLLYLVMFFMGMPEFREPATISELHYVPAPLEARLKIRDRWESAIVAKSPDTIARLAGDPESNAIFQDDVWGKYVFFLASDSTPEVLEAVLRNVAVPPEYVLHDLPRLESRGNRAAGKRLLRYAQENGFAPALGKKDPAASE